jgi:hypothetical protein
MLFGKRLRLRDTVTLHAAVYNVPLGKGFVDGAQ